MTKILLFTEQQNKVMKDLNYIYTFFLLSHDMENFLVLAVSYLFALLVGCFTFVFINTILYEGIVFSMNL